MTLVLSMRNKQRKIKKILLPLFSVVLLLGCQGKEEMFDQPQGLLTWSVEKPTVSSQKLITRAVSPGLSVRISSPEQGIDTVFSSIQAQQGLRTLSLPVGTYHLEAFSDNYQTHYIGSELGAEKWYAVREFNILAGKETRVGLEVGMKNLGLSFELPTIVSSHARDCSLEISYAERKLSLRQGQWAYLDFVPSSSLNLTLRFRNTDGEEYEKNTQISSQKLSMGKRYVLSYALSSRSLRFYEAQ